MSVLASSLGVEQEGPHHAGQDLGKLGGNDLRHHLWKLHSHGVGLDEGAQTEQVDLLHYLSEKKRRSGLSVEWQLHRDVSECCCARICEGAYIVHGVHQLGEVVESLRAGHQALLPHVDRLGQLPDVVLSHLLEGPLAFESLKRH